MSELQVERGAGAFRNGDFYLIETYSRYGRFGRDPQGKQHILHPNATALELGVALADALAHSRTLTPEEGSDLFHFSRVQKDYADWVQSLVQRHSYVNRRALFKDMAHCDIRVNALEGSIDIMPMRHDTLEGWVGAKDEEVENVVISVSSSPEAVGEALLLAFRRCT